MTRLVHARFVTRLACAVTLAALSADPAAAQPTRIDLAHTDLAVEYVNGAWRGQARIVSTGSVFAPDQAVLVVNSSSITPRVAGAAFDFIGVPAGTPYHRLNQNQQSSQLYLGASAEEMLPGSAPGGAAYANWLPPGRSVDNGPAPYLGLQVTAVRAPTGGNFSVWQTTDTGPDVFVSTRDHGFINDRASAGNDFKPAANTIYNFVGSHAHYNWGFTAPGTYEIDIVPLTYYVGSSGNVPLTLDAGVDPFTFTFDVVPVPEPAAGLLAGAALLALLRRRRR